MRLWLFDGGRLPRVMESAEGILCEVKIGIFAGVVCCFQNSMECINCIAIFVHFQEMLLFFNDFEFASGEVFNFKFLRNTNIF